MTNLAVAFRWLSTHPRQSSAAVALGTGIKCAATTCKDLCAQGCIVNVGEERRAIWQVVAGHPGPRERVHGGAAEVVVLPSFELERCWPSVRVPRAVGCAVVGARVG